PIAVYFVSTDGRFLYGNRKLCDLLKVTPETLTSANLRNFYAVPEERGPLVHAVEVGGTLEKQPVSFVVAGRDVRVQMFCRAIKDATGTTAGLLGALVEVTAEAEYFGLFDAHLPAGVYTADRDDRITQANKSFARIHGYEHVEDLLGENLADL